MKACHRPPALWGRTGNRRMVLAVLLGALLCLASWSTLPAARAADTQETFSKIGEFLDSLKNYINTLASDEQGEKELLQYLAANYESNQDLENICGDKVTEEESKTAIEKYTLLYSGLLKGTKPVDLVQTVKDKLAIDGFSYVEEKDSWGSKTIWFDNAAPGQPRAKRYVLWINEGFFMKISDLLRGRQTNDSFCLAKVVRI